MFQLHEEQGYVIQIAKQLGIAPEPRIIYHERATDTCYEKADLLTKTYGEIWKPERVVKALYFHSNGHYIGIVIPELGDKSENPTKIISRGLGISRSQAEKYRMNKIPSEMELGTCTPFPIESIVGDEISSIIVYDYPPIDKEIVDISVGGKDEEAHKVSMHLTYEAIYKILKHKFDGIIHKIG